MARSRYGAFGVVRRGHHRSFEPASSAAQLPGIPDLVQLEAKTHFPTLDAFRRPTRELVEAAGSLVFRNDPQNRLRVSGVAERFLGRREQHAAQAAAPAVGV